MKRLPIRVCFVKPEPLDSIRSNFYGGPQFRKGMSCMSPSEAHLTENYGVRGRVGMRLIARKNEDILENFDGKSRDGLERSGQLGATTVQLSFDDLYFV